MRVKILLFLAVAHMVQSAENITNIDFFLVLAEIEEPLRNEHPNFEKCYSKVRDAYELALNTVFNSLIEAEPQVANLFTINYIKSWNRGYYGTVQLRHAMDIMIHFPRKILELVKENKYHEAAEELIKKRKEVDLENSKFDNLMFLTEKDNPDLSKKVEKIVNKIRAKAIQDTRRVGINFMMCLENKACSTNAGYKIRF